MLPPSKCVILALRATVYRLPMPSTTSIVLGLIALQVAVASPVTEADRALTTPPPTLQRRDYSSDFVGYALGTIPGGSTYYYL